jgi:hypothetical protein
MVGEDEADDGGGHDPSKEVCKHGRRAGRPAQLLLKDVPIEPPACEDRDEQPPKWEQQIRCQAIDSLIYVNALEARQRRKRPQGAGRASTKAAC